MGNACTWLDCVTATMWQWHAIFLCCAVMYSRTVGSDKQHCHQVASGLTHVLLVSPLLPSTDQQSQRHWYMDCCHQCWCCPPGAPDTDQLHTVCGIRHVHWPGTSDQDHLYFHSEQRSSCWLHMGLCVGVQQKLVLVIKLFRLRDVCLTCSMHRHTSCVQQSSSRLSASEHHHISA